MARHGFEYAPHLFNTEVHKRKKLEPDVIIYAKPITNGQQTIYINYEDIYKDGEYSGLGLGWYLSDETVERIYLHELDNIILTYGETEKKQLIAGGGGNIEYYLFDTWYHTGPAVRYKTETEIEALLAYWDQKLREVSWIDTYDDVEAYIAANLEEIGRLHLRIVISYLRGVKDLIAEKEEWLQTYQMVGREEELLEKSVSYLINKQKEES